MSEQGPTSHDLVGLFESERRGPGAPPGARARVAARLAASVALAPAAAPKPSLPLAPRTFHAVHLGAIGAAFVVGAATGVAAVLLLRRAEAPRVVMSLDPITVGAPTTPRRPAAAPWSTVSPAPAPSTPLPSSSTAPSSPSPSSPTPARPSVPAALATAPSSIGLEQAVLDTARVALGRDDGSAALAATDTHARRFPHGQLSEEREAIAIQALVLLHRDAEAHARAGAFVHTYPDSALMPAIQEALRSAGSPP